MTHYFFRNQISLFFLGLLFFASCNAQVETNLPKDKTANASENASGNLTKIPTKDSYTDTGIGCSLQDKYGNMWFGSNGEGIYVYNGTSFTHFTEKEGLCSNIIYALLEDRSGYIWIGTKYGLCRYDPAASKKEGKPSFTNFVTHLNYEDKPAQNGIWSIMQDSKGTIWFGSDDGVYCYRGIFLSPFLNEKEPIINKDSLHLKTIYSMLEDKNGIMWFTSGRGEGVCRFDGKALTHITPAKFGMIDVVAMDKMGNLWFSSREHGVCHFDGKTFTENFFKGKEGLDKSNNTSISADKAGNIWFSKYGEMGVTYIYDGNVLTPVKPKDNVPIWFLMEAKDGGSWFASQKMGLYRYDKTNFIPFSE